jgi:hypothetical protein
MAAARKPSPGDAEHDEKKHERDGLVEQGGENHRPHQQPGREGHLLNQRGVLGDGGRSSKNPLLHRHPRQQSAEEEDREVIGALTDSGRDLHYRAEEEGEESEAPQRLHEGPQEAHHRAGVTALEVAAGELAEQEE